ncbi:trypsin-like serine protease [Erythrobacter colymbi]|uniref:trypsin-like serine protease n=1 Tax=Erythrobacter colymbi TaxID=1161202 RepID=UPI000A3C004C|nr:trypsin-like serine protease [Erythrobacter colymbi]
MGNTVTRLAAAGLALLGALLLPAGAAAQDYGDLPHVYPEADGRYNPPEEIPAAYTEHYRQQADAAAAACEQGTMPACTALGLAFRNGEGRPQNRPVAEVLLRRACNAGEATACHELGKLLRLTADPPYPPDITDVTLRGCQLGAVEACLDHANFLESSVGKLGDVQAADALRRGACGAGMTELCIALVDSLLRGRRLPAARAEGLDLADRLCNAGHQQPCEQAAAYRRKIEEQANPRLLAEQERLCGAGDAGACAALGAAALRADSDNLGTGDDRARALAYYDKACAGSPDFCRTAGALRSESEVLARCRSGVLASCNSLLAAYQNTGGLFADSERALMVQSALCETQADPAVIVAACRDAADALFNNAGSDATSDPARAEAYLMRACQAGVEGLSGEICYELGVRLVLGGDLKADIPRGYEMLDAQCAGPPDAGQQMACAWLVDRLVKDPAAPLAAASSDPELSADDLDDASYAALIEEPRDAPPSEEADEAPQDDQDEEEARKLACTTTTVSFEGREYTDTICRRGVSITAGSVVKGGDAPWQALIWRPRKLGKDPVLAHQFVLCGGTVIRRGWVLTAAHCLNDLGYDIRTAGHRLRLGVSNPNVNEGISYRILQTWRHPDYTGKDAYAFDIALIRYDPASGVVGSKVYAVRPIDTDPKPFTSRKLVNRTPAYTYGWGRTQVAEGPIPKTLLSGLVLMRDTTNCQDTMKFSAYRKDSAICADRAKLQQACSGDSGGPLIVREAGRNGPNTPVQIGVVSLGKECGTADLPSLFTRISHPVVKAWIDEVLTGRRQADPMPRPAPAPRAR